MMTKETEDKILEQLSQIKSEMTELKCGVNNTNELCNRHQKWLEDHSIEIHGEKESKGIKTRIDSLESAQERQVWLLRTALGGMIVSGVGWLLNLIGVGGK